MFITAKDEYGNDVSAEQAVDGTNHYCPNCGARMRVRRCVTRTDHFFLYRDQHKSKDCAEIENEKSVVRDPGMLNVAKFVRKTMTEHPRGGQSSTRGTGSASKSSKEILPPKSLRQLAVCGVCQLPANTPIEGGVLSDLLLIYRSFSNQLSTNESLGMRVIELQLDSAQDRHIRYVGFWKWQGKWHRMFFEHCADETLDFETLTDEMFHEKTTRNGRSRWSKPKYKRILVSGVWSAIDHTQCAQICRYCTNARAVCIGMQISDLVSRNQIYYSDLPDNQQ